MKDKLSIEGWSSMGLDPLTGLHDRSYIERVEEEFSERMQPWSLIMLVTSS